MASEDFNARLQKLDQEVREARDLYVNNDNPSRDEKLKEVWEKTLAQREMLQGQVINLLETKQREELEEYKKRWLERDSREPAAKKARKDSQKQKDDSTTCKLMPYMKTVESIPQLWSLWEVGQLEHGMPPISLLADRTRRERGFNRQRFHEWSTVASEIQQQAYTAGIHPRQRADELEVDRKSMKASMPQFAKLLMSQYKDRRTRFQPMPAPGQERFSAPQLPAELQPGPGLPSTSLQPDTKVLHQLAQASPHTQDQAGAPNPHDPTNQWSSIQQGHLS